MKKLFLLTSVLSLSACGTPAIVAFPVMVGAGFAINNENSGTQVQTLSEAYNDIKDGIVEGYSGDTFTSFELND